MITAGLITAAGVAVAYLGVGPYFHLDNKIDTKFEVLDKKIDTKFDILDKKIDATYGQLTLQVQRCSVVIARKRKETIDKLGIKIK